MSGRSLATKRKSLPPADAAVAEKFFSEEIFTDKGDTRWKRGKTGNAMGRPVEPEGLTDMLAYQIKKADRRALAKVLLAMALRGNLQAIQYIYDRIDGRPRQSIEQKQSENDPLVEILRQLHDDNDKALSGRSVRALPANTVDATEVREADSGEAGPEI